MFEGSLQLEHTRWEGIDPTYAIRQISLALEFTPDYREFKLGAPWPRIKLTNAQPLGGPETCWIVFTVSGPVTGECDLATGYVRVPLAVMADYTPDVAPTGVRDQTVRVELDTKGQSSKFGRGVGLWESSFGSFRAIGSTAYWIRGVFWGLGGSSEQRLSLALSGQITPPPPQP